MGLGRPRPALYERGPPTVYEWPKCTEVGECTEAAHSGRRRVAARACAGGRKRARIRREGRCEFGLRDDALRRRGRSLLALGLITGFQSLVSAWAAGLRTVSPILARRVPREYVLFEKNAHLPLAITCQRRSQARIARHLPSRFSVTCHRGFAPIRGIVPTVKSRRGIERLSWRKPDCAPTRRRWVFGFKNNGPNRYVGVLFPRFSPRSTCHPGVTCHFSRVKEPNGGLSGTRICHRLPSSRCPTTPARRTRDRWAACGLPSRMRVPWCAAMGGRRPNPAAAEAVVLNVDRFNPSRSGPPEPPA